MEEISFLIPHTSSLFAYFLPRRRMMNLLLDLFERVFAPMAGLPHGLAGPFLRPIGLCASPPPCGWSLGVMAIPRTCGRIPAQRDLPALPHDSFSCSALPTTPIVA